METIKENFENLVDKDKYQFFIFCCPAYFPFNFFRHPWVVLNKKGEISRWEIRHDFNKENQSHLYINNQLPFEGINKTLYIKKKWSAKLMGFVEGDIAKNAIDYIENSKKNYPYINKYYWNGPNSNTYIQWILDKFPEFKINLSWRFIGKNYINKKIRYTALFVENIEELIKRFTPKHEVIYAHHSTILFKPKNIDNIEVGKKYKIKIIGRAFDDVGDDLLIENLKSKNKYPHITISRPQNAPKLYSKELFEKSIKNKSIEYFDDEYVNVIEGFSDGKNIYI